MALDVGLAVAAGGMCLGDKKPQQGSVLYLELEDGERRLQRRIDKLLPTFGTEWPQKFHYATQWPRADQGGVEAIDSWCENQPDARLVVIDVLARFRTPPTAGRTLTPKITPRSRSCRNLRSSARSRSWSSTTPERASLRTRQKRYPGRSGLSGCADAFLVLKREPQAPRSLGAVGTLRMSISRFSSVMTLADGRSSVRQPKYIDLTNGRLCWRR